MYVIDYKVLEGSVIVWLLLSGICTGPRKEFWACLSKAVASRDKLFKLTDGGHIRYTTACTLCVCTLIVVSDRGTNGQMTIRAMRYCTYLYTLIEWFHTVVLHCTVVRVCFVHITKSTCVHVSLHSFHVNMAHCPQLMYSSQLLWAMNVCLLQSPALFPFQDIPRTGYLSTILSASLSADSPRCHGDGICCIPWRHSWPQSV